MGRKCAVPTCSSGYKTNKEKVSLFAIRKHNLEAFNRAICRQDRALTTRDFVCEKHFPPECVIREIKTECFTYPIKRPHLQEGVVPTIFINNYCPRYARRSRKNLLSQKLGKISKHDAVAVNKRKKSNKNADQELSRGSNADTLAATGLVRQEPKAVLLVNPVPLFTLPKITDVRTEIEEDDTPNASSSSITHPYTTREEDKAWTSSHHSDDINPLEGAVQEEEEKEEEIFEIVDSDDDAAQQYGDVKDPLELSEDNVRNGTTTPVAVEKEEVREDGDLEVVGLRIQALQAQIERAQNKILYLRVLAEDFSKQTIASRSTVMS